MNRQQFETLLDNYLIGRSGPNGGNQGTLSMPTLARAIQGELSKWNGEFSAPPDPLPSAECLAAFVAGSTTEAETQQVIAGCIYDPGFLLQLLIAWQERLFLGETQPHQVEDHIDDALVQRLLAIHSVRGWSRTDSIQNEKQVQDVRPSLPQYRRPTWAVALTAIALSLLGLVVWWAISSPTVDRKVELTVQDPLSSPTHRSADATAVVTTAPSVLDASADQTQGPFAGGVKKDTSQSIGPDVDHPELPGEKMAKNDRQDEADRSLVPGDHTESSELEGNEPDLALSDETSDLASPELAQSESDFPSSPNLGETYSSAASVSWTRVVGLIAEQQASGVERWRALLGPQTQRTENPSDENLPLHSSHHRANSGAATWLLPPGCFARGSLPLGGELILAEGTILSLKGQADEIQLQLLEGEAAAAQLPVGSRLRLSTAEFEGPSVSVKEPATFSARLVDGQLVLSVHSGDIYWDDQRLENRRAFRMSQQSFDESGDASPAPGWMERLPSQSSLSRNLLAKLAQSDDLTLAIEQSLADLLNGTAWQNNPRTMRDVEILSKWRGSLSFEDPLEPATHPVWPVRHKQLMRLFGTPDGSPFDRVRLRFAANLNASGVAARDDRYVQWQAMIFRRQIPTRSDLAEWLSYIDSTDALMAAAGDLMLRVYFNDGPAFNPRAPVPNRMLVRRRWMQIVSANSNRRSR